MNAPLVQEGSGRVAQSSRLEMFDWSLTLVEADTAEITLGNRFHEGLPPMANGGNGGPAVRDQRSPVRLSRAVRGECEEVGRRAVQHNLALQGEAAFLQHIARGDIDGTNKTDHPIGM